MNVVALSPHNDDVELFAAFSALRHRAHVIVCLRSCRMAESSYPGGTPVSAGTREAETAAAMALLGLTWEQWPYPDCDPDWGFVSRGLERLQEAVEPGLVLAPAVEEGGNEQHNALGELALGVFGPERTLRYMTYTSNGRSNGGREVEYEPEWVALKLRALACHESQCAHPVTRGHFLGGLREYILDD